MLSGLFSLIATAGGTYLVLMATVALVVLLLWLRVRRARLRALAGARHRRDRTTVAGTAGGAS